MIARYVPARMSGFMMGAYFVATGVSQYLGSVVANFARMPAGNLDPLQSLPMYTQAVLRARLACGGRGAGRDRAAAVAEQACRVSISVASTQPVTMQKAYALGRRASAT